MKQNYWQECSIYVNIGDKNLKQFCEQKKIMITCNSWKILLGEKSSMRGTSIIQAISKKEKKPITLNGSSLGTIQCNNTIVSTST